METNWIINLIDQVTAPMRKMTQASLGLEDAIEGVTEAFRFSGKEAKEALANETKHRNTLLKKIKEQERSLKMLEDAQKTAGAGKEWGAVTAKIERSKKKLQEYRTELNQTEADLKDINTQLTQTVQKQGNWQTAALGMNQVIGLAQTVTDSFSFNTEIMALKDNLQLATGFTGDALDDITTKVHQLSAVYQKDSNEIMLAANATAKQMGISFDDALNGINAGFERGADLNGEFLSQLKEYMPFAKQAGMSVTQTIAMIANAAKNGIYADKAFDAIKEGTISLSEMGKAQQDALAGIGLSATDLAGKSSFEAVQVISKAMKGATTQAKQLVLADIFKGAGEDAGLGFIEGLASNETDINKLPVVEKTGAGLRSLFAGVQAFASNAMGGLISTLTELMPLLMGISAAISIYQTLASVTWIQTIATKAMTGAQFALNAVMTANPIALVVVAILGLVAALAYLWNTSEGFRENLYGTWEAVKTIFMGIFKFMFDMHNAVIGLIAGMFNPKNWFNKSYSIKGELMKVADVALKFGAEIGESFAKGKVKGAASFQADQKEEEQKTVSINESVGGSPLSYSSGTGAMTGKGKAASGSSINGGASGGGKSITMNLEIKNYFQNIASGMDVRKVADEVAYLISDKLKDASLSI